MSLPYSATVFVNWLPVICMPSPESPAKRITARSITSGFVFGSGTSVTVDMFPQVLAQQSRVRHGGELHGSRRHVRRSEEHTSELQSLRHLVCRLLLEKKKKT